MLFVWLLALGTGIANACLVQADHARHGHLGHRDADVASMTVTGLDAMADDHGTSADHLACQNFCAAGQTGVVKQPDDAPTHLDSALVLVSRWWVASLPIERAFPMPALDDPSRTEPSVFIRFLRLTI